jgi:hypothetical protein
MRRDNKATQKQVRGLDLTIKAVKKKFPFIKDWGFSDDSFNETFVVTLPIDLYIDFIEVAEMLGLEPDEYYLDMYYKNPEDLYMGALSPFFKSGMGRHIKPDISDISYETRTDIINHMNKIYEYLPDDFKITYISDKYNYTGFVQLSIDDYKQYIK